MVDHISDTFKAHSDPDDPTFPEADNAIVRFKEKENGKYELVDISMNCRSATGYNGPFKLSIERSDSGFKFNLNGKDLEFGNQEGHALISSSLAEGATSLKNISIHYEKKDGSTKTKTCRTGATSEMISLYQDLGYITDSESLTIYSGYRSRLNGKVDIEKAFFDQFRQPGVQTADAHFLSTLIKNSVPTPTN